MMRRSAGRRPAATTMPKPQVARTWSFPAPIGGWVRNANLATPGARMPDGSKVNGAFVLENWFPTATGIRMRRGSDFYAAVGDETQPVTSLFVYANGNNEKLFAATATTIYDVTSPLLPTNELIVDDEGRFLIDHEGRYLLSRLSIPGPDVDELQGGDWSVAQFATPGGVFLRCVNGVDTPLSYDGAAWSETPAITGVDAATLSYVWQHQRRLFFIKKDSLSAFYLPADSIGGAAVELPMGAVFKLGGSLLFGSSWSTESGDGLNEQCVFVSTKGEVAVFQGTDPSTAATWARVGVYRVGTPLGAHAHIRAGGDLVIATDIGFVPLSQALLRDVSALSPTAVSYPIEDAWNEAAKTRPTRSWVCETWPNNQMTLVALPTGGGDQPQMLVANTRTGKWGLFTGWDGRSLALFKDRLFFGSAAGRVIEAEVTGLDLGKPYTATSVPLFDDLKAAVALKTSQLMRAVIRAVTEILPRLSLQADYRLNLPSAPDAFPAPTEGVWGGAIWGQSTWAAPGDRKTFEAWQSVGGSGYAVAPTVQITSGSIVPPDVDLVRVDMTYDQGGVAS